MDYSPRKFFTATFLLAVLSVPMFANAVMVVAPGAAASMEGDTFNVYPFSLYPDGYYQQLYDASLFGGQSGVIDQILFRIDGDAVGSSFNSAHDIEVRLSHTSVTPGTMSTTFVDNIGVDETVVLSGTIQFSSTYISELNPFNVALDINDVFSYNGTDNLLLQISHSRLNGGGNSSPTHLDAVSSSFEGGDLMQRVWSDTIGATTGNMAEPRGLVTAFVINPVPEPTTLYLFGSVLLGLIGFSNRMRINL